MKLTWVTFKVSDLEKSMFFYTNLLGLDVAAKFGSPEHQIVMLGRQGEPKVELIFEPGTRIENPGNGVSVGLETEDLNRLTGLLNENGYPVSDPVSPNPQIRFSFVKDPSGYTVQLVEQKGV